jgi:methionyl-tRNA formyltransferase
MQKIIFLGSKPIGYYCLEYLIQNQAALQYQIIGVLSNDNPVFNAALSVKALASLHHIPVIDSLAQMPETDILYSVQYHQILSAQDIAKAKTAFNLHMAPLPEYRGCNQFSFAIADDKKEFGTTIHKMDARIDHGDIAFEKRFAIPENCWVNELYSLTEAASLALFKETLAAIIANNIEWTPQENYIATRGTSLHYRKEIQDLKKIELQWDAQKIERHIRATYMPGFEPPYTIINNKKIYFTLDNPHA